MWHWNCCLIKIIILHWRHLRLEIFSNALTCFGGNLIPDLQRKPLFCFVFFPCYGIAVGMLPVSKVLLWKFWLHLWHKGSASATMSLSSQHGIQTTSNSYCKKGNDKTKMSPVVTYIFFHSWSNSDPKTLFVLILRHHYIIYFKNNNLTMVKLVRGHIGKPLCIFNEPRLLMGWCLTVHLV